MGRYLDVFKYERIQYKNKESQCVQYINCVMLKDVGEMKKGEEIPVICICYGILGYGEDGLIYDEGYFDERTSR